MSLEQYRAFASRIIWNFVDCQNLSLSNIDVIGSILAPNATIVNAQVCKLFLFKI